MLTRSGPVGLVPMLALILALAAAPARADTLLDLSETASVSSQPDRIAAALRAEATAPTPATAQEKVNRMMAGALEAAHHAPGVDASTGAYSVWLAEPPPHPGASQAGPALWRASQMLDLAGGDGAEMLALVGAMQTQGMAVQSLGWVLSPEAARTARAAALRQAISGLRARAEEAAGLLGLRFASFRTVRLTPEPRPFPMQMRAAALGATPPSAEQGPIETTATVTAEAVLAGQ